MFRNVKKKTVLLCTSQHAIAESKIKGSQKRFYFVKLHGNTSLDSDVKGKDDFEVDILPILGNNSAFSIGVPTEKLHVTSKRSENEEFVHFGIP